MVAYNFKQCFVQDIETGFKLQTIRADRRRHARPGEKLQLYTGMRTKHCRLIRDDVVCEELQMVHFDLRKMDGFKKLSFVQTEVFIENICPPLWINDRELLPSESTKFARLDGFHQRSSQHFRPFTAMVLFFFETYGPIYFEGVCIRWNDLP